MVMTKQCLHSELRRVRNEEDDGYMDLWVCVEPACPFEIDQRAVEPSSDPVIPVPELVWNSCGPGNGGLWDCPDSIHCAGYCSPPWTFEKATQQHQQRHREWVAEEIKQRAVNRT